MQLRGGTGTHRGLAGAAEQAICPRRCADLVQRGLRVRLDSASLITGQKQLTLDVFPDSPPAELRMEATAT